MKTIIQSMLHFSQASILVALEAGGKRTGITTFGIAAALLVRCPGFFEVDGAVISLKDPDKCYAQFPELQVAHPPSTSG